MVASTQPFKSLKASSISFLASGVGATSGRRGGVEFALLRRTPNGRIGRTGLAATLMATLCTYRWRQSAWAHYERIGRLRKWGLSPAPARPIGENDGEFRQPMSGA